MRNYFSVEWDKYSLNGYTCSRHEFTEQTKIVFDKINVIIVLCCDKDMLIGIRNPYYR